MIKDLSDKMIADIMGISINTVKAQKNIAYKTLDVHTGPGTVYKYLIS
jgi:DNA-binding CsgD family transcriptional regulator